MLRKKVCWNITARCNQNCKYCHRFLNIDELNYNQNKKILENLIDSGITEITWTGGEALLYPNLVDLLKMSKENGISNKLITNGILLAQSNQIEEICNNLDYLTLSIDSIDNEINFNLGRGREHCNVVKQILDYTQGKNLKLNINTVVTKRNLNQLYELGDFLNNYEINTWKFFKFMPLREKAETNRKMFEITDNEFEKQKGVFKKFENIKNVKYKQEQEIEESLLIIANGDIIKTTNGKDIKRGNALYQNVIDYIEERKEGISMKKIRTLVAHSSEEIRNTIVKSLSNLGYVEVVATTNDGVETYNKIVELKPDIVFSKYNFDNMNGLELMKKSQEMLKKDLPVFNIIEDKIPDNELKEALDITNHKIQTMIREPYNDRAIEVMEVYKNNKFN